MSDSPIYTGWVTLQLSGDITRAQGYQREGRRMLGTLLQSNGVSARLARGEPGGFFRKTVLMPDGTRLTAITNEGLHLVRIESALPQQRTSAEHHTVYDETGGDGQVIVPETSGEAPTAPVPPPPVLPYQHEETSEEKKKDMVEYLWIGVRSTTPGVPWYALNAMLIEPDSGPLADGLDGPKRGIVNSVAFWTAPFFEMSYDDGDGSASITSDDTEVTASQVDSAISKQYAIYHGSGDGPQRNMIPGTHCLNGYEQASGGEFFASANGVMCYVTNSAVQVTDPQRWLPFDPETDDNSGSTRDYGDRHLNHGPVPETLWDVTFSLDPHEDEGEYPCETRPQALAARRCLEQNGMVVQALPGQYLLALHCYDNTPGLRSDRAGAPIPLYPGSFRSATSDYDNHMKPINSTFNTGVEIEVRMGKDEAAVTQRFTTTIPAADDRDYTNIPFGQGDYDECSRLDGPNPFGPNFAPQLIAIDVLGGSADWVDLGDAELAPILGGGHYALPDDDRRPFDIFIYIDGVSQPDQADYADYAGHAIYQVLEAASSGSYGQMKMNDPGGESAIAAAFGAASKSVIWRYDAMSGALSPCALIGSVSDYPYGTQTDADGNPFQSPYVPEMFWYYPYKTQDRNLCRNSVGIALTALRDSWFFENGQSVYYADPPDPGNCC